MKFMRRLVEQILCLYVLHHWQTRARALKGADTHTFLCAIVDYNLPDANDGEAIDFTIESKIHRCNNRQVRRRHCEHVLSKQVVDYIPKENLQVYEYLARLLVRLKRINA